MVAITVGFVRPSSSFTSSMDTCPNRVGCPDGCLFHWLAPFSSFAASLRMALDEATFPATRRGELIRLSNVVGRAISKDNTGRRIS